MDNFIKKSLAEHIKLIDQLQIYASSIQRVAEKMTSCLKQGGKIIACGNGGSAADAQHIVTELVVRLRSDFNRKPLPALSLTTNTSILTACGNDYGFDAIFARQVEALGKENDLLIAISTSGDSVNVLKAVEKAQEMNIFTVLLGGKDGGKIKNIVDDSIIVPSFNTARIQEVHILIAHILCEMVESLYFK
jgi:D-sedoheptulose 7-phosphate isomerase